MRFPVASYDTFHRQIVPRWTTNHEATDAAYDAFMGRACTAGCVLVAHSQGAYFALNQTLRSPDKVKALVALEPAAFPDPATAPVSDSKRIPQLWLWGDNLDRSKFWTEVLPKARAYESAFKSAGGELTWVDLPALGIPGNSHFLMMDTNSDTIAKQVHAWMHDIGLMRR